MQYLLIQNEFESPTDGFTTLGFTTATKRTIGQFGSGANHGILCCLRAGIEVIVYCGNTRLLFSTREVIVKEDGIGSQTTRRVTVKKGTNKRRDLDWDLQFGAKDWTNVGMALREFISNAIDRHTKADGYEAGLEDGRLQVSLVDDKIVRAKTGYTRIFVQVNDEVRAYYANLGDNFLHFSDDQNDVDCGLIPRYSGPAKIYRCGVYVMTVDESEGNAIFDYNFQEDEIEIDESRNSNIYVVRAACAKKLRRANRVAIARFLISLGRDETTFESKLEPDRILTTWEDASPDELAEWKGGAAAAFGGDLVVSSGWAKGCVEKKGHAAIRIDKQDLVNTLKRLGVPTGADVLDDRELSGTVVVPATEAATAGLEWAWEIMCVSGLRMGDVLYPDVLCYQEKLDEDTQSRGYMSEGIMHLRQDLTSDEAHKEALNQLVNLVETDYSRRKEVLLDIILSTSIALA